MKVFSLSPFAKILVYSVVLQFNVDNQLLYMVRKLFLGMVVVSLAQINEVLKSAQTKFEDNFH